LERNGIRAVHKKGLFVPFIKKYQPDILCLQETKANNINMKWICRIMTNIGNSAIKKGYSGTAIFARKSLGKPLSTKLGIPENIEKKYKLEDKYGDPTQKDGSLQ